MTVKYFFITLFVTFLLALTQVFVKIGLTKIGGLNISIKSFTTDIFPFISSLYLWAGLVIMIISSLLWMKVLSEVKLSIAYPMISLSYILGLLASKYIFAEISLPSDG